MLDESLKNITLYITGRSISFTLTNPTGNLEPSFYMYYLKKNENCFYGICTLNYYIN